MLLLGSSGTGSHGDIAKAVDFDGTNDYLLRSSDLVGNADGKTFTFSAWVWLDSWTVEAPIYEIGNNNRFYLRIRTDGTLDLHGWNSSSTLILNATTTTKIPLKTWVNILLSFDMSSTSNRHIYINDVSDTVNWSFSTYTNSAIDFTETAHGIASVSTGGNKIDGRLAHVFLAYEYVDLSVEANRRIFITADRKPA